MASQYGIERERGIKEAGQQLAVLRERWPLVFPVQAQDVVRWHGRRQPDRRAFLLGRRATYWKMAAVYCRGVLARDAPHRPTSDFF
jgi:hypothetical protein